MIGKPWPLQISFVIYIIAENLYISSDGRLSFMCGNMMELIYADSGSCQI